MKKTMKNRCPVFSRTLNAQCDEQDGHEGLHTSDGDGFYSENEVFNVVNILTTYLESSLDTDFPKPDDLYGWKRRAGKMQAAWEGCHSHREELLVRVAELEKENRELRATISGMERNTNNR